VSKYLNFYVVEYRKVYITLQRNYKTMTLITFKISRSLLKAFDTKWKKLGFKSRSEAIRFSMMLFMTQVEELEEVKGKCG